MSSSPTFTESVVQILRVRWAFFLVLFLASATTMAHVRQRSFVHDEVGADSGQESITHWDNDTVIKLEFHDFSGTLGNSSTLDKDDAYAVVNAGLEQWTASFQTLTASLSFNLDDGQVYRTSFNCEFESDDVTPDDRNLVVFSSKMDDSCGQKLVTGSGVVGVTKVLASTTSGEILSADMQFDDETFLFTDSGSNDLGVNPKVVNLNNVVVHEMGHMLGLDHSPVRQSAMLFAVAEDLQTVKNDDRMGLFSIYSPSGEEEVLGRLRGSVTLDSQPVFGAAVFAIHARTLEVSAQEMTDTNGAFDFCALPTGPHIFYASNYEPFGANAFQYYVGDGSGDEESEYFSSGGVQKCWNPGCELMTTALSRSWQASVPSASGESGGRSFDVVQVSEGTQEGYLNLIASSAVMSLVDVGGTVAGSSVLALDSPRVARLKQGTLGLTANTGNVGTDIYEFDVPSSTTIALRTAALSIYSRVKLNLEIFEASDTSLSTDLVAGDCSGSATPSDSELALANDPWLNCSLSAGTYFLRVTGTTASCTDFPGNSSDCESTVESASTNIPFYIVALSKLSEIATNNLSGIDLATSSSASTEWKNLPTCDSKSVAVTTLEETTEEGGGCCGTIRDASGGQGPDPRKTFFLSLLLSPLLWAGFLWKLRMRAVRAG